MDNDTFFNDFVPSAIDSWLERQSGVSYTPYLMGSRYSQEPLKAEFLGMTQETTREEMLAALVRGLCEYQHENLAEVGSELSLDHTIVVSGGALNESIIRAKKRWMSKSEYRYEAESSMRGAALLGLRYLEVQT